MKLDTMDLVLLSTIHYGWLVVKVDTIKRIIIAIIHMIARIVMDCHLVLIAFWTPFFYLHSTGGFCRRGTAWAPFPGVEARYIRTLNTPS